MSVGGFFVTRVRLVVFCFLRKISAHCMVLIVCFVYAQAPRLTCGALRASCQSCGPESPHFPARRGLTSWPALWRCWAFLRQRCGSAARARIVILARKVSEIEIVASFVRYTAFDRPSMLPGLFIFCTPCFACVPRGLQFHTFSHQTAHIGL